MTSIRTLKTLRYDIVFWHLYLLGSCFLGVYIAELSVGIFDVDSANIETAALIELFGVVSSIAGFWVIHLVWNKTHEALIWPIKWEEKNYNIILSICTLFISSYSIYLAIYDISDKNFYGSIPWLRPIFVFFETAFPFLVLYTSTKSGCRRNPLAITLLCICLLAFFSSGKRGVFFLSLICFVPMVNKRITLLLILVIPYLFIKLSNNGSDVEPYVAFIHAWFVHIREISLYTMYEGSYNGMTYLSGFVLWVPSELLEFKQQYSLGKLTRILIGEGDALYASGGKRIGIFGEAYINFGLHFVAFFGFMFGALSNIFSRKLRDTKQSVALFYMLFFPIGFFESGTDILLQWYILLFISVLMRFKLFAGIRSATVCHSS